MTLSSPSGVTAMPRGGGQLTCGTCTAPSTCGGSGTPNVCSCVPTTCAQQGKNCGTISDGCGGTLACGSCAGGMSCQANVCVVSPPTATYDPVLRAPRCSSVGASCDSGTLLNGRANLGPEPNQPNTLQNSCADGTIGGYHSDESLDRLKIATLDGGPLAAGKTVRIEATVWPWSSGTSDYLDLYYASNAASPVWTHITTLGPTQSGAQVLSATYTLPAGTMQAIRGQFRYQGYASPCTGGSYTDHDDLVFAVQ